MHSLRTTRFFFSEFGHGNQVQNKKLLKSLEKSCSIVQRFSDKFHNLLIYALQITTCLNMPNLIFEQARIANVLYTIFKTFVNRILAVKSTYSFR